MQKYLLGAALLAALTAVATAQTEAKPPMNLFEINVKALDGTPAPLSAYKGKVCLVVNLASKCGYTPQYAGLQKLYADNKDKGFVILGFPSNDFGGQEPGTPEEITTFCHDKFGVTFPLFEKVTTKGPDESVVYKFVTLKQEPPKWNFTKYLVGKDGQVIAAFPSAVTPEDPKLLTAIDAALKQ